MQSSGSIVSIAFSFSASITALVVGLETYAGNKDFFALTLLPTLFGVVSWFSTYFVLTSKNVNEMHKQERKNLLRIGIEIMKEKINDEIGIPQTEKLEDDVTKGVFVVEVRKCLREALGDD